MKTALLFLFLFIGSPQTMLIGDVGITEKNYLLLDMRKDKEVTIDSIITRMQDYDIILFGEEHNDSVAHFLETNILKKLYERFGNSVVLSMEMFDRDVQTVLDEYLAGTIKESHFKKDARVWSNYRDYRPMVEFSKEKGIQVVAANAPMRYVSLCNRKGMNALQALSPDAKKWMAPLPFDTATGKYYEKLREIMGYNAASNSHDASSASAAPAMPSSLAGHSLWDATMAYSIASVFDLHPKAKVLHVNGRFHSDDFFGIYLQLLKYAKGKKVLVISCGSDDAFPAIDRNNYKGVADFVVVTDPKVPKTFKE